MTGEKKGGKPLAMMKKKQEASSAASSPSGAGAPSPTAAAAAAAAARLQSEARKAAGYQPDQAQQSTPPGGRKSPTAATGAAAAVAGAGPKTPPTGSPGSGGKPKGKNFAAMAQRNVSPPSGSPSAADKAQMEAKKRAAEAAAAAACKTATPQPGEARLSKAPSIIPAAPSAAPAFPSQPVPPPAGPHMAPLVGQKLQSILASIDPSYSLEPEAEEHLLRMADDFLDNVVKRGMRLAKHRGSDRLDVQDLSLVLRKGWGITVPGGGIGPLCHR